MKDSVNLKSSLVGQPQNSIYEDDNNMPDLLSWQDL
jgi:hypothetical protein